MSISSRLLFKREVISSLKYDEMQHYFSEAYLRNNGLNLSKAECLLIFLVDKTSEQNYYPFQLSYSLDHQSLTITWYDGKNAFTAFCEEQALKYGFLNNKRYFYYSGEERKVQATPKNMPNFLKFLEEICARYKEYSSKPLMNA